jgi:hypothetical protein
MNFRKRMMVDLDRDIQDHIEIETQDNIGRGMSSEEARYAACCLTIYMGSGSHLVKSRKRCRP